MLRLVVVGGGKMGSALLGGVLAAGEDPASIGVVEKLDQARQELVERFPGVTVSAEPLPAEGAVLAVKPADADSACAALAASGLGRLCSVVAGVSIERLSRQLGPATAVVRAMPNVPALLGAGASAIAAAPGTAEEHLVWAEQVLSSVGIVVRVAEKHLDAVTGLSGSGPAYVFLLAEAMIDAGVQEGLDRESSRRLVTQTLLGSARMLAETGESATSLRHAVVSPGGTTAAGLRALEARAFRAALLEAVAAATERAHQLGG